MGPERRTGCAGFGLPASPQDAARKAQEFAMSTDQHFDVIIIGTGAGGGTLARALSTTGKRILILERGEYLPREKENWDPATVVGQGHYKAHETWLDKDGREFHPGIHYWVGGNTKVYGSALI